MGTFGPRRVWSDFDLNVIKEMAASGKSTREIAETLGKTRNQIIGAARRWNIKLANSRPCPEGHFYPPRKRLKAPKVTLPGKCSFITIPKFECVGEENLDACQYLRGEPKWRRFCNKPLYKGSFCKTHALICYQEPKDVNLHRSGS